MTRALVLAAALLATAAAADVDTRPPQLRDVGIEQRPGAAVPLDLVFRDEGDRAVRLGDYFTPGKPVLLSLVYFGCPMLCGQTLRGLSTVLGWLPLDAGKDFTVLSVSFDPKDTPAAAAAKKAEGLARYDRPGGAAGWHFLVGDADAIARLTDAVGFRVKYDPESGQFAHAPVLIVLTPDGKVSRYLYGFEYASRDVRLGLVEASANRIGSVVDQVLLFCFHYDPATGRYTPLVMNVVRAGGLMTVAGLAAFVLLARRREAHRQA